jgi:hypothetical protein
MKTRATDMMHETAWEIFWVPVLIAFGLIAVTASLTTAAILLLRAQAL